MNCFRSDSLVYFPNARYICNLKLFVNIWLQSLYWILVEMSQWGRSPKWGRDLSEFGSKTFWSSVRRRIIISLNNRKTPSQRHRLKAFEKKEFSRQTWLRNRSNRKTWERSKRKSVQLHLPTRIKTEKINNIKYCGKKTWKHSLAVGTK